MALILWPLVSWNGKCSQHTEASHQRHHKSQVSFRGPPCVHGVWGTSHGEVRDINGYSFLSMEKTIPYTCPWTLLPQLKILVNFEDIFWIAIIPKVYTRWSTVARGRFAFDKRLNPLAISLKPSHHYMLGFYFSVVADRGNYHCHSPLHEECPQHNGHMGDPRGTPGTCGAIGEMNQVNLEWGRALGV